MSQIRRSLRSATVLDQDGGATAVEYGLMVALIAVVILMSVSFLGGNVGRAFDTVSNTVANGGGGGSNGANNNGQGGGWGGGVGGGQGHN